GWVLRPGLPYRKDASAVPLHFVDGDRPTEVTSAVGIGRVVGEIPGITEFDQGGMNGGRGGAAEDDSLIFPWAVGTRGGGVGHACLVVRRRALAPRHLPV